MHKNQRKLAIATRRTEVSRLRLRGLSQTAIAEKVGASQTTICNDLKAIDEELLTTRSDNAELHRERQIRLHETLISEAFDAWDRSKLDAVTKEVSTEGGGEGGQKKKARRIKKGQCGDPRFLSAIQASADAIARMRGLYAASEHIHHEGAIQVVEDSDWYGNAERLRAAGVHLNVNVLNVAPLDLDHDSSTIATHDSPAAAAAAPDSHPGLSSEV